MALDEQKVKELTLFGGWVPFKVPLMSTFGWLDFSPDTGDAVFITDMATRCVNLLTEQFKRRPRDVSE